MAETNEKLKVKRGKSNALPTEVESGSLVFETDTGIAYVDADDERIQIKDPTKLSLEGGTMEGSIDMGDNNITTSHVPEDDYDVVNKKYLEENTAKTFYAICTTTSETKNKTATCDGFTLEDGTVIYIRFQYTNSADEPTLDINDSGSKPIMFQSEAAAKQGLVADTIYAFIYTDDNYEVVSGSFNRVDDVEDDNATFRNIIVVDRDEDPNTLDIPVGSVILQRTLKYEEFNLGPTDSSILDYGDSFVVPHIETDDAGNVIYGSDEEFTLPDVPESVSHAEVADEATHATSADTASNSEEAAHATSADSATTAEEATHAESADKANYAETSDEATHSQTADVATKADSATVSDSATEAEHAKTADSATTAESATEAEHASSSDSATKADTADKATEADHATSSDSSVEAEHAKTADTATSATTADKATTADSATEANHATEADHATSADSATKADSATTADSATNAETAQSADEATKLRDPQTIDGVSFDGSSSIIHYGTCETAADTSSKTVSCTDFNLVEGAIINVTFNNTNTSSSPTLDVNNTGAKNITFQGSDIDSDEIVGGTTYTFVYTGDSYEIVSGSTYRTDIVEDDNYSFRNIVIVDKKDNPNEADVPIGSIILQKSDAFSAVNPIELSDDNVISHKEGTSIDVGPSTDKVLEFGENFTVPNVSSDSYGHISDGNNITFTMPDAPEGALYTSEEPIEISDDNVIKHSTGTSIDVGPSADTKLDFGSTFTIPHVSSDNYGHVSSGADRTFTMPDEPEQVKYTATKPIQISSSNDISHSTASSISVGPTANVALDYGSTFNVPSVESDDYGHVTSGSNRTITIPPAYRTDSVDDKDNEFRNVTILESNEDQTSIEATTGSIILKKRPSGICKIYYGTCTTASGTANKVVACDGFELEDGSIINIYFTNANTASTPRLNVDGTGVLYIYCNGSQISSSTFTFYANTTYMFVYHDGYYEVLSGAGAYQLTSLSEQIDQLSNTIQTMNVQMQSINTTVESLQEAQVAQQEEIDKLEDAEKSLEGDPDDNKPTADPDEIEPDNDSNVSVDDLDNENIEPDDKSNDTLVESDDSTQDESEDE